MAIDPNLSNSPEAILARGRAELDFMVAANKPSLESQGRIYNGQRPPPPDNGGNEPAAQDQIQNELMLVGYNAVIAETIATVWASKKVCTISGCADAVRAYAASPDGKKMFGRPSITRLDLATGNYDLPAFVAGKLDVIG